MQLAFPGGGGTFYRYGNAADAVYADASAYLKASNGYRLPSVGSVDTGCQEG